MYITLYRKYRPSKFEEVAGENEIVKTLINSLKNKSLAHAYLFLAPRGVGKTTVARLIAKGVNCLEPLENGQPCDCCSNCLAINDANFPDLIEIDAASNRSIDEIRNLKEKINYQPVIGAKKVYIIDEAHMLTKEAFNALLKTLEEPPSHIIFILATTELEKIIPTIISRCQRYDFKVLSYQEVKTRLEYILKQENFTADEEVFSIVYENSGGSMRDAISILERLLVTDNERHISVDYAENILGLTPKEKLELFLNNILSENLYNLNENLEQLWMDSTDIELFFKDLAKHCKNKIASKNLDINKGYKIIEKIYDVLSKFKFEDDKRLVGYVIASELLNINTIASPKIIKEVIESKAEKAEPVYESALSLDRILDTWSDLTKELNNISFAFRIYLMNAKPFKVENCKLTILFPYDSTFSVEQLTKGEYAQIFIEHLRNFYQEKNLTIECILNGKGNNRTNDNDELSKKVVEFFNA